ncbi:unnamed protein product, partial [Phaeothamnion confervicola]
WSRITRPAIIFYVYPKARDCVSAAVLSLPAVMPVVALELLVILVYSCLFTVMYHPVPETDFQTLWESWLATYALSTSVNNPDMWLPVYARNPWNSLLFISFLVLNLFLLHNIVLATIWQQFADRMRLYTLEKQGWRVESINRAFAALDTGR